MSATDGERRSGGKVRFLLTSTDDLRKLSLSPHLEEEERGKEKIGRRRRRSRAGSSRFFTLDFLGKQRTLHFRLTQERSRDLPTGCPLTFINDLWVV